ncbi:hypothetical protein MPTK2_4g16810 [Marchantia polymorpha subsp. ruderalis]
MQISGFYSLIIRLYSFTARNMQLNNSIRSNNMYSLCSQIAVSLWVIPVLVELEINLETLRRLVTKQTTKISEPLPV